MPPTKRPQNTGGPASFVRLTDDAVRGLAEYRASATYAMDTGVDVVELCRYVAGVCTPTERLNIEQMLSHNPWAMSKVVALTKAARSNEKAKWLLAASRTGDLPIAEELVHLLDAIE